MVAGSVVESLSAFHRVGRKLFKRYGLHVLQIAGASHLVEVSADELVDFNRHWLPCMCADTGIDAAQTNIINFSVDTVVHTIQKTVANINHSPTATSWKALVGSTNSGASFLSPAGSRTQLRQVDHNGSLRLR